MRIYILAVQEAEVAKDRSKIPEETAAEVLFTADHTCCVCRDRSKQVHIHHIDEDPTNHATENLAVLCLECHDKTQISGGFGRKLGAQEVIRFRDDWTTRVGARRNRADELAAEAMARLEKQGATSKLQPVTFLSQQFPLSHLIQSLPDAKLDAMRKSRPGRESPVSSEQREAAYTYIAFLEVLLTKLASYYPKSYFDSSDPRRYFSSLIASFSRWHSAAREPRGPGTRGTIIHSLVSSAVVGDLERMIVEMVYALSEDLTDFNFKRWKALWNSAVPQ